MELLDILKKELASTCEGISYLELSDAAWSPKYTQLRRKKRILKRAIRRLERI